MKWCYEKLSIIQTFRLQVESVKIGLIIPLVSFGAKGLEWECTYFIACSMIFTACLNFLGKKPPAYSLTSMVIQESAAGAERHRHTMRAGRMGVW